jgi:tetratricopeptide (TPR) repeat protein
MSEENELIADGVLAERAGAMDRALHAYRAAATAVDPDTRAAALTHQADVFRTRCEWDAALTAVKEAQALAAQANLPIRAMEAVVAEANIFMARGMFDEAGKKFHWIAAETTDPRLRGIALQNLGSIYAQSAQPRSAARAFRESLGNFHKAGYDRGEVMALNNLGRLAIDVGDYEDARQLLERALPLARDIGEAEAAAMASLNLGWVLCNTGQLDRAQDLAMSALGYFAGCENRYREIECLRLIGEINDRCEDPQNAQRCYELAIALAEQIGSEPERLISKDKLSALRGRQSPKPLQM